MAHPNRQHERDSKTMPTSVNQNHHQQQYARDPREPLDIVPAKAPKGPASTSNAGKNSGPTSKAGNDRAGNSAAASMPAASQQQSKQQPKRSLGSHATASTTGNVVAQDTAEDGDAHHHAHTDEAMSAAEQSYLKERTRQMFYHAYDSYMQHAFPEVQYVLDFTACAILVVTRKICESVG